MSLSESMLFSYLQEYMEFLRSTAQEAADSRRIKLILFHEQPHGGKGPNKPKGRYIKNRMTFKARTVIERLSSSHVRHYQILCQWTNSQAIIFKFM